MEEKKREPHFSGTARAVLLLLPTVPTVVVSVLGQWQGGEGESNPATCLLPQGPRLNPRPPPTPQGC